jgi:lysophospholipase L1-like esterase
VFSIPRYSTHDIDLSAMAFFLEFRYEDGTTNETVFQDMIVNEESIQITWQILSTDLKDEGTVLLQLKANDLSGTVKWRSYIEPFYVGDCIDAAGNYTGDLSAYEALVTRCVLIENAEVAREAAEDARQSSETSREAAEALREQNKDETIEVTANAKAKIIEIEERFNRLTAEQQQDAEVIEARKGKDSLKLKMDDIDLQLADKLNKGHVSVSDIDKNKGKFDQTYMSEELFQQMAGNTPINAIPANKSITQEKLAFTVLPAKMSKNMFNKNTISADTYIMDENGTTFPLTGYFTSDYIPVSPQTIYAISPVTITTRIAYYTKDKIYISRATDGVTSFTTPINAEYIRASWVQDNLNLAQIEVGNTPTLYESYGVYFDDSFVKDQTFDGKKIKYKSINPEQLTIIPVPGFTSKNIFNKDTIQSGKYIDEGDGKIFDIAGYFVSDYVEILGSTDYYLSGSTSSFRRIAFYDSNKTFISFVDGVGAFTTPLNAVFIRYASNLNDLNSSQIELGNRFTGYSSYGVKIKPESMDEFPSPIKTIHSIIAPIIFEPKNIKLLGDSITHGVGGTGFAMDGEIIIDGWNVNTKGVCWANMLKTYFESKFGGTVKNYGCAGTDSKFIVTNINTLVTDSDDIVICMIGTNDRNTGIATKQEFYNNLKEIHDKVKAKGKEIIFMSNMPASVANETDPNNPKDYHMEDIDYITMKVTSDLKLEYISLYKELMEYSDMKNISIDSLLSDGLHPNDEGYKAMFNIICDRLGIGRKRREATW